MTARTPSDLLKTLRTRFEKNRHRHVGIAWAEVEARIVDDAAALQSLGKMEDSGGEPDVVGRDDVAGHFHFVDCSPESPAGRRSCCYDGEALRSRKENRPAQSAVEMAEAMGVELLTEAHYRSLQQLGQFDTKTSSWILTPPEIRALGGALFCDRRYGHVFVYHNGAQSYYAARGFRGLRRV